MSRILSRFEKKGLLHKKPSTTDGRRSLLQLTYAAAGFQLVHSEPDPLFGEGLVSETWELTL